jgi:probable rRNA maturation factor
VGRARGTVAVAARVRGEGPLAAALSRRARRLLALLRLWGSELSLVLVSDRQMRRLNREYRGVDRATDVLAFPLDGRGRPRRGAWLLGDVVIATGEVTRVARAEGGSRTVAAERLLIHGLLHLLGYDHERSAGEARRMAARERALAAALRGSARLPR